MECPDVDELVRLSGGEAEAALAAHVSGCEGCRARAEVIEVLLLAGPLEPVPDPLLERVMAGLPDAPAQALAGAALTPGHRAVTFLLATLTTAVAAVLSGVNGVQLELLLAYATLVGVLAAVAEPHVLRLPDGP